MTTDEDDLAEYIADWLSGCFEEDCPVLRFRDLLHDWLSQLPEDWRDDQPAVRVR